MNKKIIYLSFACLAAIPQLLQAQNVGIGTTTPTAPLDVNGAVRIRGGAPAAGKVLTSDANGVAEWSAAGVVQPNTFVLSDNVADANLLSNNYTNIASTVFQTKTASSTTSLPDGWNKTSSFISERADATIISSGNEFIVFGGYDKVGSRFDGGIYDPIADTWKVIPDMNDGLIRNGASVVWTGSKLIVWGGYDGTTFYNSGYVYDTAIGVWTAMNTTGAPAGRESSASGYNAATNELIIWGGSAAGPPLVDGAKYNLTTNSWTTIAAIGAPTARWNPAFGVNEGKLFIFGGRIYGVGTYTNEAFYYNIASNTWSAIAAVAPIAGRWNVRAAYTGSGYVLFGGNNGTTGFADGAIFNTSSNTWTSMSTVGGAPGGVAAVACGGGYYVHNNYKYNLSTQVWSPLPSTVRFSWGIGANAACLLYFGGKVAGTGGAGNATNQMLTDGLRYFWTPQTVTSHSNNPMSLYLYKKN